MWKSISQLLAEHFGEYYHIKHREALHNGEMNEIWRMHNGIQPVFVKINEKSYRSMFRAESEQLEFLQKTQTLPVPKVYGIGCSHSHSFLALEYLEIENIKSASQQHWATFGQQLAQLHLQNGCDQFGLEFDTWLGPHYQPNEWQNSWATFFAEQRIGWQLQLCKEKGLVFGDINRLVKSVQQKLQKHQPKPSLLHGNLWVENIGLAHQQIFSFDPACYWGDPEIDLAFSELFEPFPEIFYQSYQQIYPLDEGYAERKPLYWLYYLLNFSARFKGQHNHYAHLTDKIIQSVLKDNQN